jgi:2'-5' RNA ligase
MQYFIAHVLKGEAAAYHRELSNTIAKQRKLAPLCTRVPPHLTVKAPFAAQDISKLRDTIISFAQKEPAQPFTLSGFDHFGGKALYMRVEAPKQTHMLIRRLQDRLRAIPWLTFSQKEFPVILHATIVYPRTLEQCKEILHDLRKQEPVFECTLNSIAILRKPDKVWNIDVEYQLEG